MPNASPAALVTGANKGIGYEIVRQLSRQFRGTVYLTARDAGRGAAAEKALHDEGLTNVAFLQMDVNDKKSIEQARDFVREKHGGLDILVNNAGILICLAGTFLVADESASAVKDTLATNFSGLLEVCTTFFPILRSHARVVNVSSTAGSLRILTSEALKKQLVSDDLTVAQLEEIIEDYSKTAVKSREAAVEAGYPTKFGPYGMSKIGVTALSRVQQRMFDHDKSRVDIVVNACCPGFVATDINNHAGPKSLEEGADTPVYLALLPPNAGGERVKPHGEFVHEKTVIKWTEEEIPNGAEIYF